MTNILLVTCSPRGQVSESTRLSQKIVSFLLQRYPTATVINRFACDLPHINGSYAAALGATGPSSDEAFLDDTFLISEELIGELESADILVIGTPMHNFTVPSALKAWIDYIVRVHRTFDVTPTGKVGRLRDRPVFVAVASGGRFSGEHAHQPDFLTPYLKAILGIIGLGDLRFFSTEGTTLGQEALLKARARSNQALEREFSASLIEA